MALPAEGGARRMVWAAVVGTAPAPILVAAGRCGWEGGRRRLCVEQEAAPEEPGRQALKWEEEERACCRFALGAACIGASACTLALEVHMLALEGHRKASLVGYTPTLPEEE